MNTEELYAAAMAEELPRRFDDIIEIMRQKMDELAGDDDLAYAIRRLESEADDDGRYHNALKAELKHHWQLYNEGERAIREHRATTHTRYMQTVNAAAIRRIAGYLGVE